MSNSFAELFEAAGPNPALLGTIERAKSYAAHQAHRQVTLEHLLLALSEDDDAVLVLSACKIDFLRLKHDVGSYLGRLEDPIPPGHPHEPVPHEDLVRIFRVAAAAAKQRNRSPNGGLVLAAIVGDGRSPAANMLRSQGLTFDEAVRALQEANAQLRSGGAIPAQLPTGAPYGQQPPAQISGPDPSPLNGLSRPAPEAPNPGAGGLPAQAPRTPLREAIAASAPARRAPQQSTPSPPASQHGRPPAANPGATEQILADARRKVDAARAAGVPRPTAGPQQPPAGTPLRDGLARLTRAASSARAPSPAPTPHRSPTPNGARPRPSPAPPPPQRAPDLAPPPAARPAAMPPGQAPAPPHGPAPGPALGPAGGPQRAGPGAVSSPPAGARSPGYPVEARAPHATGRPSAASLRTGAPSAGERSRDAAGGTRQSLAEGVPRRMRVGVTETVEVRISRQEIESIDGGAAAEFVVARAMTLRLRSANSAFFVEPVSLETQWIENRVGLMADEFAIWRWNVTPRKKGRGTLQLSLGLRTLTRDGHAADTPVPSEKISVRVGGNVNTRVKTLFSWVFAAAVGALLAVFGSDLLAMGVVLVEQVQSRL